MSPTQTGTPAYPSPWGSQGYGLHPGCATLDCLAGSGCGTTCRSGWGGQNQDVNLHSNQPGWLSFRSLEWLKNRPLQTEVQGWIKEHNRRVKETGEGVRILPCLLPIKSPWLNPMEPRWVHAKRRVVEPDRVLAGDELAQRVCEQFGCQHEPHLAIPDQVS